MQNEVKYTLDGLFFTWDDRKAAKNWQKHRIDFRLAAEVFLDECAIDVADRLHDTAEPRRQVIGETVSRQNTLFVVYVERESWDGTDVFRLISARNANKKERKIYEQNLSR